MNGGAILAPTPHLAPTVVGCQNTGSAPGSDSLSHDGLTARQSEHELVVDPLTIPAASPPERRRALHYVDGRQASLGSFGTAVEAAVAVAWAMMSDEEDAVSCLWVACDRCDKWRRLPSGMPGPLPAEWFCWMHPDSACRQQQHRLQKGVQELYSGRFRAKRKVDGKDVYLGYVDTAVEAAVAYARAVGEYQPPTVVAEAEGLRLHLSSSSSTGYKGVTELASGRFRVQRKGPCSTAVTGKRARRPVAAPVDGNEAACPNCYCFACDAPVSACRHWRGGEPRVPAHCNAHAGSAEWRTQRSNAKRQRTRAARAARDPLGLGS
ncbi:hypothetical protein EMIHUDRAFT_240867 [Emiliania huxleyi CCMP1516]|uniref:CW-type domain-containing protein n=2 Tax=Emiliania huxleyi TaxID=2903 RepID=A0A0D3JEA5_EMIH1|nr:hypothetical protein EMIHUDRAFT_240867 [Emiliania huxleyi CCMP1516]EOD21840.1 hypothetical protein EMIHUDRAFT_240867 [Emiliania huxleyi CCMP1516]|eukprot:XP_005774269.1 hypothetical protein EMIHUDRAFT_240867 [Emiliania huxleyi CCMP1516]